MKFNKALFFIAIVCCCFSFSQGNEMQTMEIFSDSLRQQLSETELINAKKTIKKIDSLLHITINDSVKAFGNNLRGNYYRLTSDSENAMKYYLRDLFYSEKIKDSLGMSMTLNNISLILNATSSYERSLKYKKEALSFCPNNDNRSKKWKLNLLANIASTYRNLKKYDSSFYYLDKGYTITKKSEFKELLGTYYHHYSINHLQTGNYRDAIENANKVQNEYKNYVSRPMLENSIFYSAKSLNELGEYNKALEKANKSLEMLMESGMVINAAETYEFISDIYENIGDYKNSAQSLKYAKVYSDSIFNLEKNKIILDLEKKYQTEKKEKENLKLKQETAEKDLNIAQKNNYILLSTLLFGSILISLILYQLKKFKSKNTALKNSIEKREKLEKELEIVRENIAKDFHDDLGNKLARIATLSDLMISTSDNRDKDNIINALKSIKMDSDVLYKGTRDFMFSLKTNSDYLEELFTYLSDFGEEFFESFDVDFFVEKRIKENVKLPYYWNRQIIMIFKEAMTNVVKHSDAKMVILSVNQDKDTIEITLKDNGEGFNLENLKRKNGIENMYARAKKINAKLIIVSNADGSKIHFKAPLNNNQVLELS